jgi:signal peptidase II
MAISNNPLRGTIAFKLWISLAILVLIIDQLTKVITLGILTNDTSRSILPFMNWVLVYNPGAAFSFLADSGGWQKWFFISIGCVASVVLVILIKRHSHQKMFAFSLAMILGGAVGNVIDRFKYGAVVDFIDVFYQQYHWPAFNIADSAITLGTALLVLDEIRRATRNR